MKELKVKICSMILLKKWWKYQHFHQQNLDKKEYLAGKEVLPSYQSQIMKKAKFSYSPLRQKVIKTNENIKK